MFAVIHIEMCAVSEWLRTLSASPCLTHGPPMPPMPPSPTLGSQGNRKTTNFYSVMEQCCGSVNIARVIVVAVAFDNIFS